MHYNSLWLSVAILATWRITALFVYDGITQFVRNWAKVHITDDDDVPLGIPGKILSCFWCTSVYVGVLVGVCSLFPTRYLLLPFALSGAAIILNHWTRIVRDVNYE